MTITLMYSLKVDKVEKVFFQADNCERLVVNFTLFGNPDEGIFERSLAFPLEKTDEEVKAALKKYVDNFNAEAASAVENKALHEAHKNADKTIESLQGLQV